jgi:hypothetical protein
MPRASHRLDVVLVSADLEREPDAAAFEVLRSSWVASGRLSDGSLVRGGFRRLWLDVPGHMALYANQQGGYYVRCPKSGGNLARIFGAAVQAWRGGGERSLVCPHCGEVHALEAVTLAPPGVFGLGAVVFSDTESVELGDDVQAQLRPVLGESLVIVRRVG